MRLWGCLQRKHASTPQGVTNHPNRAAMLKLYVQNAHTLTLDIMIWSVRVHTLRDMCYRPLKHRCACPHPGILWQTRAAFCPLVPTTMSHTISSCQISPVTLGQVPTRIVPLSVSRPRQLLGRVTPCYSGLQGSVVARELVVSLLQDGCLWMLFFFFCTSRSTNI